MSCSPTDDDSRVSELPSESPADTGASEHSSALDIRQQEKADEHMKNYDLDKEIEKDNLIGRQCVKGVFWILVVIAATGCFFFGKLSFMSLAQDIKILEGRDRARAIWRMFWILVIPYGLCWLRCIWNGFGKSRMYFPWPNWKSTLKVSVTACMDFGHSVRFVLAAMHLEWVWQEKDIFSLAK